MEWKIDTYGIVNEDSGDTVLVLTHKLKSKILYVDVFEFVIMFTASIDNSSTVIDKDIVTCSMENDTRNTDYWIVDVVDAHYPASSTTITPDSNSGKLNLGQDWFVEVDDVDRGTRLCTPPSNQEPSWAGLDPKYFACKEIHCEIRRNYVTLDSFDFEFDTALGSGDTMEIAIGEAYLHMNQYDPTIDEANWENLENRAAVSISIDSGALSGLITTAFAAAALLATSF